MDFQNVSHWQNNKVDRRESSRMGWSDISVSLHGPVVRIPPRFDRAFFALSSRCLHEVREE